MKIGDKVLTKNLEVGTIVSEWEHNDDSYHWWVKIPFKADGQEFTTTMPFKSSDLKLLEKK